MQKENVKIFWDYVRETNAANLQAQIQQGSQLVIVLLSCSLAPIVNSRLLAIVLIQLKNVSKEGAANSNMTLGWKDASAMIAFPQLTVANTILNYLNVRIQLELVLEIVVALIKELTLLLGFQFANALQTKQTVLNVD
jgi:hypothetical protein